MEGAAFACAFRLHDKFQDRFRPFINNPRFYPIVQAGRKVSCVAYRIALLMIRHKVALITYSAAALAMRIFKVSPQYRAISLIPGLFYTLFNMPGDPVALEQLKRWCGTEKITPCPEKYADFHGGVVTRISQSVADLTKQQKNKYEQHRIYRNIFISGDTGVGKTKFAERVAATLVSKGHPVFFLKNPLFDFTNGSAVAIVNFLNSLSDHYTLPPVLIVEEANRLLNPTTSGSFAASFIDGGGVQRNRFSLIALSTANFNQLSEKALTISEKNGWLELERRFMQDDRIHLDALSEKELKGVLLNMKEVWEQQYSIEVTDDLINSAFEKGHGRIDLVVAELEDQLREMSLKQ
jgi:hypothetical protein